jgi:hypothetical protein
VECDTRISRSRRPIAVEDDQTVDERSYSAFPQTVDESSYSAFPPGHPRGIRSDCQKVEALTDSLDAQFLPITYSSAPAGIETVDVALRS